VPLGILAVDQPDLLLPAPTLQLFFAGNGRSDIGVGFVVDQARAVVFSRKLGALLVFVFANKKLHDPDQKWTNCPTE
jgi:hypothetical protein